MAVSPRVSLQRLLPLLLFATSLALLPTPLLRAPSRTQLRIVCGRPQRPEHGPPGYAKRRTLTGFFVEKPEVIRTSRTRLEERIKRPKFEDDYEQFEEEPLRNKEPLSRRSEVHRTNWADPAYRNATLAKRVATLGRRGLALTKAPAAPSPSKISAAAARKVEALHLFNVNEAAWMQQRLDSGEMQRLLLDDGAAKQELQARRSAVAKERHRARQAAGATDASAAATRKPTKAKPTPRRAQQPGQPAAAAWRSAAEATAAKPAAVELSAAGIRAMKVGELRDALAARSLPTDGLKPALAARLLQHHGHGSPARRGPKAKPAPVGAAAEAPVKAPAARTRSRRHTQWLSDYMRDKTF